MSAVPIPADQSASRRAFLSFLPELLLAALWGALMLWNLGGWAAWWDEGWTMLTARTLLDHGHYGRMLDGELAPHGLEASPITVGLVALGFKLFGFGVWQARLPFALLALATLAVVYLLALRLYGRGVARGALLVLLGMSVLPHYHILMQGRQAMSETPQVGLLLAGYACLLGALRGRSWLLLPAMLLWALGVHLKAQYLWFWALSLAAPAALLALRRQWREAALLAGGLAGAYLLRRYGIAEVQGWLLAGRTMPTRPVVGLVETVAIVPQLEYRLATLRTTLTYVLPSLLGCAAAAWVALRRLPRPGPLDAAEVVRLCLLALIGAWWGWYLLLSVGFPRYLYPLVVIASIFTAALLERLTFGYDWRATLASIAGLLRGRASRPALGALAASLMIVVAATMTTTFMAAYYSVLRSPLEPVVAYLNTQTPPGARIESYEAELFFLLERPYHYPPDQVHVTMIRRAGLEPDALDRYPLEYDALASDPDYLVVGTFASASGLYDAALATGQFELVLREGDYYEVYRRRR